MCHSHAYEGESLETKSIFPKTKCFFDIYNLLNYSSSDTLFSFLSRQFLFLIVKSLHIFFLRIRRFGEDKKFHKFDENKNRGHKCRTAIK